MEEYEEWEEWEGEEEEEDETAEEIAEENLEMCEEMTCEDCIPEICGEDECERKCQEEMEMRGEDDLFEEWEEEE